jgi:hypothetical protein
MRQRWVGVTVIGAGPAVTLAAQTPKPTFEVVSIKPRAFQNEAAPDLRTTYRGKCTTSWRPRVAVHGIC